MSGWKGDVFNYDSEGAARFFGYVLARTATMAGRRKIGECCAQDDNTYKVSAMHR
jgi:hypothetical protein